MSGIQSAVSCGCDRGASYLCDVHLKEQAETLWLAKAAVREFPTGATRDTDDNKYDYEGFISPLVLERYAAYMHANRVQSDGALRASDNWQKGIPISAYMKSLWRHFFAVWKAYRNPSPDVDTQIASLCAVIFNASGYIHELVKRS